MTRCRADVPLSQDRSLGCEAGACQQSAGSQGRVGPWGARGQVRRGCTGEAPAPFTGRPAATSPVLLHTAYPGWRPLSCKPSSHPWGSSSQAPQREVEFSSQPPGGHQPQEQAGVLLDVQNFFHISDSNAGLLQTVFICCLLLSAPVFGYLGDRHSRKATLSFGILLWSGAGLSGSFISPQVMPCLEVTGLILLLTLVPDPPRGAADKQEEAAMGAGRSSWCEDVRYLGTNWSFVWSTLGVTAMAFVTGALSFWVPKFLFEARVVHGLQLPCITDPCSNQDSLIFGSLTVVTGIIGVVLGAEASRRFKRVNPRAEPLVCACSLLAAAPCLYLALLLARTTFTVSYVFLALGELLLSCNWAVVAEILLSVVLPRCRGTAEALQITAGHILGDAGSPYLTGLVSSALRARRPDSYLQRFLSLQHSFLCCAFVIALGGGCFLLTALHLERDQTQARRPSPGTPDSTKEESQALLSHPRAVPEAP
ncbi:protein spinster homolog 3 isoform X7 [Canis lupus familiaris]|uniref:protein spinster homolog 3 isoform X7 n=1 Tax=Canis lupus familiaris TaxID=9615 RepID=UPI0015F13455|nr:protein spinster homolog 3 isoform X7 [Canis lupus familiaris]XP_038392334.1 protein spinster homolog 3 isoform X7 [Canis lupus familiaris]